jgi:dolichyl-phosphate-mannose--protein O-mannosyl transferase
VLVAAMPLAGLAAVLFYTTRNPTGDGDTIKAMFLLPAVPLWALSFGFACDTLLRRSRRLALPVFAVLAACAVVSLAFATFALVS